MNHRYVFLATTLAAALVVSAANAAPPVKLPSVQTDTTLPASVCGFPVEIHFTAQHQHARIFGNGAFAAEGELFATLSANGKSLDVNVSGPGRITPNEDGTLSVRVEGRNLVFFGPGDLGANQPGALYVTTGLVTETLSSTGQVVPGSFATTGTVTNVCALLA